MSRLEDAIKQDRLTVDTVDAQLCSEWLKEQINMLFGQIGELKGALENIQDLVDEQANDEGLWAVHLTGMQPIGEAYLQQELRRLHGRIERLTKADGLPSGRGLQNGAL